MAARKRILFVDDEPLILEGLQRAFRPMRGDWDMLFADSGALALDVMAREPVDVVVSDMHMPGMNGADLLEAVMRHHPRTVRLILSGHADRELMSRCVGAAHQFLAKPCDPEDLKSVVQRALASDRSLANERLKQLVSSLKTVPSMPSLYSGIVRLIQDPDADLNDIADLMARDIGMTAQILKLANSAYFGLSHRVSSTLEAVTQLGLETIKTLVLAVHLFSEYDGVRIEGWSLAALWSHSQRTAAVAKAIALAQGAEQPLVDEILAAAMLHDVGKLVLWTNLPERCRAVLGAQRLRGISLHQAEVDILGAGHADVGGYLLGLWDMPATVVEAIGFHHNPGQSGSRQFGSLTAVHAADWLVHQGAGDPQGPCSAELDTGYLEALGLAQALPHWGAAAESRLKLPAGA